MGESDRTGLTRRSRPGSAGLVADAVQILELPRNVLVPRMVLPRRPTVSHRGVSDRLLRCRVRELPGSSVPLSPLPWIASPDWSRRDGRGEATETVQLRLRGCPRLRCRTRRLRRLGTSRAQFLPEDPPIGTSSVHGTSSTWKRARVLSVLALASCSERIWVDAPAHRQRTMGRAERRVRVFVLFCLKGVRAFPKTPTPLVANFRLK